jgi:hypothetical protein
MLVTPVGFPPISEARCISVTFGVDSFFVRLEDGPVLEVPLECYPRLAEAKAHDREDWRSIGRGIGIHWPSIDEDISVAELLGGSY